MLDAKDESLWFNIYDDLQKTKSPSQTAWNYVKHCEEHGLVPVFPEFVFYPSWHEKAGQFNERYCDMLGDFSLTDEHGNYAPQQAVKMDGDHMPKEWRELLLSGLDAEKAKTAKLEREIQPVIDEFKQSVEQRHKRKYSIMGEIGAAALDKKDGGKRMVELEKAKKKEAQFKEMERGREAIGKLVKGEERVEDAMRRDDLNQYGSTGSITFDWGKPGNPTKNFKGGYGVSHIFAKHGAESLAKVIDVLANGEVLRYVKGNKSLVLTKDGYEAVLALTRNGAKETWLLSGWSVDREKEKAGATGEVGATSSATQNSPTFSRAELGAAFSGANIQQIFDKQGFARVIRWATGWERGADGKWRWEEMDTVVPDGVYEQMRRESEEEYGGDVSSWEGTLGELLGDHTVFEAYPQLRDVNVQLFTGGDTGEADGFYWAEQNAIRMAGRDKTELDKGLAHEVQHAIQEIEGFAKGSNENGDNYKRSAGENEANAVMSRMNLTAEQRRRRLIQEDEAVAREAQIVLMEQSGPSLYVGKRARAEYERLLEKKRPDMTEDMRRDALDYLHSLEDTRENNRKVKVAVKWLGGSDVTLPNDAALFDKAIALADAAGVDPMRYSSPRDVLAELSGVVAEKERPIDPETVPTLRNRREVTKGLVIYDVDDSKESQRAMREVINTHWGKDANPWCLLQGDGEGNLTEKSWEYWQTYSDIPKQVAFYNGKLLAFRGFSGKINPEEEYQEGGYIPGARTWWDRQDKNYIGIPVRVKFEDGRRGTKEFNPRYGKWGNVMNIERGDKKNGVYETWYNMERMSSQGEYKDGKQVGAHRFWNIDGQLVTEHTYHNDGTNTTRMYENGVLVEESRNDSITGRYIGTHKRWYNDGSPWTYTEFDDGGKTVSEWARSRGGDLYYELKKDGEGGMVSREWYDTGKLKAVIHRDVDGKRHGESVDYYENGVVQRRVEWSHDNYVSGESRFENGNLSGRSEEMGGSTFMESWFGEEGDYDYLRTWKGETRRWRVSADGTAREIVDGKPVGEAVHGVERGRERDVLDPGDWNGGLLFRTSGELDAEYPTWLSGQTTGTGQHTTQITSTKATYEKIGRFLGGDKSLRILDASSGLGAGTKALREMGYDVDDVEPYPSDKREAPTYRRYEDVEGEYDVVISNAVLNVIPDDWRADVLKSMASKLKVGGRLFINVRDAAGVEAQKRKIELDSPSEILVTDKKGNIRAYQKGFTPKELVEYVQEQLGDGFKVERATEGNSGLKGATAVVVTRERGARWGVDYNRMNAEDRHKDVEKGCKALSDCVTDGAPFVVTSNIDQLRKAAETLSPEGAKELLDGYSSGKEAFGFYDKTSGKFIIFADKINDRFEAVSSYTHEQLHHVIETQPDFKEFTSSLLRIVEQFYPDVARDLFLTFREDGLSRHESRAETVTVILERLIVTGHVSNIWDSITVEEQETLKRVLNRFKYGIGRDASGRRDGIPGGIYGEAISKFKNSKASPGVEGQDSAPRLRGAQEEGAGTQGERALAAKRQAAERMAGRLNTGMTMVEGVEGLRDLDVYKRANREAQTRMESRPGFYDPRTGQIVVNLERCRDAADAVATVLHETAGHYGLRELVALAKGKKGEGLSIEEKNGLFSRWCMGLYERLDTKTRAEIDRAASRNGWRHDVAVEERMAELAEIPEGKLTEAERGVWNRAKAWAKRLLMDALGIDHLPKWINITDAELRYMVKRSRLNLENRGRKGDPLHVAQDITLRQELGLDYDGPDDDGPSGGGGLRFTSPRSQGRKETNYAVDWATSFVTGRDIKDARRARMAKEEARRERARDLYEKVLRGEFNDVTLQAIENYINEATPNNPYGRRVSERLPQRALRKVETTGGIAAVDALFSRISESDVRPHERTRREGRRKIEERKKELLKKWAQATGHWHTDLSEFTDATEPMGRGTDSDVYLAKDGTHVIKASKGKPEGKRFRPDVDNIPLFNSVFPDTAYEILGYGEIDGKFVRILQQPLVDFRTAKPLSVDERAEFMSKLRFEPINEDKTAFSNGEILVADLQKGNIVRDANGEIRVIDADVKLHTKDVGGKYEYPPVERDSPQAVDHLDDSRGTRPPEGGGGSGGGLLFRGGSDAGDYVRGDKLMAASMYEARVRSSAYQFHEANADHLQGLKEVYRAIYMAKNGGSSKGFREEDYKGYENAYTFAVELSSLNKAEMDAYTKGPLQDMVSAAGQLIREDKKNTGGTWSQNQRDLEDYMIAKHGLERNELMSQRAADAAYQQYLAKNPNGHKTARDFYEYKDYSGLTAVTAEAVKAAPTHRWR